MGISGSRHPTKTRPLYGSGLFFYSADVILPTLRRPPKVPALSVKGSHTTMIPVVFAHDDQSGSDIKQELPCVNIRCLREVYTMYETRHVSLFLLITWKMPKMSSRCKVAHMPVSYIARYRLTNDRSTQRHFLAVVMND